MTTGRINQVAKKRHSFCCTKLFSAQWLRCVQLGTQHQTMGPWQSFTATFSVQKRFDALMVLIFWNTIFARHNFLCKRKPSTKTHPPPLTSSDRHT